MSQAHKIDGKACAAALKETLKEHVIALKKQGITPCLGTILVGSDPGSLKYVGSKQKDCQEIGIDTIDLRLPETATYQDIQNAILQLNHNDSCTGYIVQLPLPQGINSTGILELIDPRKDADGLHPMNLGRLVLYGNGASSFPEPCTPAGIIHLLKWSDIQLNGKNICVIGRGITAGRPLGLLLTRRDINATVDTCHTGTHNLIEHIKRADIIISAVGKAHFITADMINDHAILVDVGVSRGPVNSQTGKSHIMGDFDPSCYDRALAYTPNPGGVGPMTRVMLLNNIVSMAASQLPK